MRGLGLGVGVACFVLAGSAQAQGLDDLKWLAGCWVQTSGDRTVEEHWTDASGGVMLETGRTVKAGQLRDYEFTRIEMKDGALVFTADPMNQAEASFTASRQTADSIEFENLNHDFPRHVRYRSTGPDSLHAEIDGPQDPTKPDSQTQTISWDYTRCAP